MPANARSFHNEPNQIYETRKWNPNRGRHRMASAIGKNRMIRLLTWLTLLLAAFSIGCARDVENRLFYNLPENKKITIITNPEIELIGIKFEDKDSGRSRTSYLKDPIQLKENGYAMRGLEHRLYLGGSPARYEEKELPYVSTRILVLHGVSEDYVDLNTFLEDSNSYPDVFKK